MGTSWTSGVHIWKEGGRWAPLLSCPVPTHHTASVTAWLSDCEDIRPVSYVATLMSYVATLMSYVATLMSYIAVAVVIAIVVVIIIVIVVVFFVVVVVLMFVSP